MTAPVVEFRFDNVTLQRLNARLAKQIEMLGYRSRRRFLKKGANLLKKSMRKNITSAGRPTKWARLKRKRTFKRKYRGSKGRRVKKMIASNKPLQGRTKGVLTAWPVPEGIAVGTRWKAALYHDQGAGPLPVRKFVMIHREDSQKILDLAAPFIDAELARRIS